MIEFNVSARCFASNFVLSKASVRAMMEILNWLEFSRNAIDTGNRVEMKSRWNETKYVEFNTKTEWKLRREGIKVARNEVENASFAQRSAHRDSRIWRPKLIEPAAERKRRARADDDRRSNRPTPTHRFCDSAIFRPITPYNVWFFWVSRHRSIILAKEMETFSGRFWEIPGNVLKLEFLKMLFDHKITSVYFQTVSGMSSWSFSYRWTQYQWEKNSH